MRYHNRRSMEWRPHPFGDKVGCGTRIEHPMNKRSNITIEIVKMVALARGGGALLRTAKGWFLEFRLIPVLLWSYTAVILGTAVAIVDIGGFDATCFALGIAYTVPPVATAYRPFAGEWLGGFPGVLLSGLGAYAIQTRSLALVPIVALCAHALVCMGMLMMHHYLDAPMDAAAVPPKRTTVVALGFPNSKRYAAGIAFVAALLYGILGLTAHPAFLLGFALTLPAVWIHLRTNPTDLESVTRNELRIIQLGIAAGLSTAVGLAPVLWPMLPLAVLGYVAHLAVVSPPAELGRAWRRAPGRKNRTQKT